MIWTSAQTAIVRKDMREAMSTRGVKAAMLVVPLIMALAIPIMFTIMACTLPAELGDFGAAVALMPIKFSVEDATRAAYYYLMNYMMPTFFIMIPVMASSVVSGSSIVGERERHTLATLMYSPLTVKQLFTAKVAGAVVTALIVTGMAFAAFLAVAVAGSVLVYGGFVLDIGIWLSLLLLIAPSVSLAGVTVMVLASAKARSFQEAQQYAAMLTVPLMLLMLLPQMLGMFLFNAPQLAIMGAAFLVLALIMLRIASARFTSEKLLK